MLTPFPGFRYRFLPSIRIGCCCSYYLLTVFSCNVLLDYHPIWLSNSCSNGFILKRQKETSSNYCTWVDMIKRDKNYSLKLRVWIKLRRRRIRSKREIWFIIENIVSFRAKLKREIWWKVETATYLWDITRPHMKWKRKVCLKDNVSAATYNRRNHVTYEKTVFPKNYHRTN